MKIVNYVMLTASEEMTEEIILDFFVKIWINRHELPGIQNFSSYIFILTRNYTLNTIRKSVNDRKKHMVYSLHLADEEKHPVIRQICGRCVAFTVRLWK